jgi:K+-sensing histidine kinase KdpD
MQNAPVDPRWHRLLSLTVHEFRTPMTVVAGYIRMLLKDRAGPLTDQQRRLLEEAEKSCGRLSALLAEISDLSNLDEGTATFNRSTVDLKGLLTETVADLPPLPDREITVDVTVTSTGASILGDPVRLKTTLTSILNALRRELVTSDQLFVREQRRDVGERAYSWIVIGDGDHIEQLAKSDASALGTFDEWRSGCGLSLAVARRVLSAHEGFVWSPTDNIKSSAIIALPLR